MTPAELHESQFIAAFVDPEKRQRYTESLKNAKKRSKLLDRLNHFFDFVRARAAKIPRNTISADLLRSKGAPDIVHLIGGNSDGKEMSLEESIESCLESGWGAVISCVPGRLALYLQEFPPGDAFLLSAPPSKTN